MDAKSAYELATDYGSFMSCGGLVACLDNLHPDDGRPVSEEHRAACRAYVKAILDHIKAIGNKPTSQLLQLGDWFRVAPLYSSTGE
jgi:hypothetical protein